MPDHMGGRCADRPAAELLRRTCAWLADVLYEEAVGGDRTTVGGPRSTVRRQRTLSPQVPAAAPVGPEPVAGLDAWLERADTGGPRPPRAPHSP